MIRRQRRIEGIVVAQHLTPASTFGRRQWAMLERGRPKTPPVYNLPKFDFNSVRQAGRFLGPRVS